MNNSNGRCDRCKFWIKKPLEQEIGECRKGPPPVFPAQSQMGIQFIACWPPTKSDQWCGEYQPKLETETH